MDKEFLASSIMTASPIQLLVITYDLFFQALSEAEVALKDNRFDEYDEKLNKCRIALRELMEALNMEYDISVDLMALYLQVQKLLITAKVGRKLSSLQQIQKIMGPLHEGWKEIARNEENSGIIDEKTANNNVKTSVLAGMTYGKSDINIIGNYGSEFKA